MYLLNTFFRKNVNNFYVRMGEYDMATTDEPLDFVERKVRTIVIHPKYRGSYQDIALDSFLALHNLMKKSQEFNPFNSKDENFKANATAIFQKWYSKDKAINTDIFDHDIGLLRLNKPIKFQDNIMPICLPEDDEDFVGESAWVTGWGDLYDLGIKAVANFQKTISLKYH